MMEVVHLMEDEKFIDAAISLFEGASSREQAFVVLSDRNAQDDLLFVKSTSPKVLRAPMYVLSKDLQALLLEARVVIVHGLSVAKLWLLSQSRTRARFVWLPWGFDIYLFNRSLTLSTMGPWSTCYWLWWGTREKLDPARRILRRESHASVSAIDMPSAFTAFVRRTEFIAPVVPGDFRLIQKHYGSTARMLEFNYAWVNPDDETRCRGDNLLLGNSATPTNNHVEAIRRLKSMDWANRTIYAPLSYGHDDYAKLIRWYGARSLGSSFQPLNSFLPFGDYMRILDSCGIVLMNHYRQQGMGNILATLWRGARVILNHRSPILEHMRSLGVALDSLDQHSASDPPTRFSLLPDAAVERNREILVREYSWERVRNRTADLMARVID